MGPESHVQTQLASHLLNSQPGRRAAGVNDSRESARLLRGFDLTLLPRCAASVAPFSTRRVEAPHLEQPSMDMLFLQGQY